MKKSVFFIGMMVMFLISTTSCTTDSYDKDMDNAALQVDNSTSQETDPIIIPKKD